MTIKCRWRRISWMCLAWGSMGLGAVGAFLPLLPTTPFLLVAAWAAPKGAPQLGHWLHKHPRFGRLLHAWQTQRAIPIRAKCIAITMLAVSWLLLLLSGKAPLVLLLTAVLFLALAIYLITRPAPQSNSRFQGSFHHE